MNPALLRRTFRDYALIWTGAIVLVIGFMILFSFAVNSIPMEQGLQWLRLPWVRNFISALVGADLAEFNEYSGIVSLGFSHPLVWVLLIGFALTVASGGLAGEIDRGTMDLLAALPVSRSAIYAGITTCVLIMGAPLCAAVWVGARLGLTLMGQADVPFDLLAIVTVNLFAAYVLIACMAVAISANSQRRGAAVAAAFVLVFYCFVINFLSVMWPALDRLAFTSFLNYYAPLAVIRDQRWPVREMIVLLAAAAVWWTAGLILFRRRDIPAR